MTVLQDERAMKEVKEKQAQENDGIEKEISDLLESIEPLRLQRSALQAKRGKLDANLLVKQRERNDLRQSREALEIWMKRRESGEGYQALADLRQKLEQVENEIEKYEEELTDLLRQHDMNRDRLASIFSGAVRAVLPYGRYDGKVSLDSRELAFSVTHGPAMSGEAVETLSVLLADIVSLIHNTVCDRACLPGFLLHDSPREADLGLRIYKAFIRLVVSLQEHFGSPDACPFQYILTTTTPPPDELQDDKFVRLRLNAAEPEGLLLRRNIALSPDDGLSLL